MGHHIKAGYEVCAVAQAQHVAQLAISAVEACEKARRKADEAAEELAMAQRARAVLADDVAVLRQQQAELPARQQLEAGSPVIATVLPSVEGGEEVWHPHPHPNLATQLEAQPSNSNMY